ncbi:hypothetical protein KIN20_002674 [Parelaphostrongylus tenuis]|uniref:Uncharacterized protein n=1 Tax=Parelaphostrongylus tenuis TaxID=148309 RepID=A0AAD5LW52_PARTN|nr:hypothetical protein KIN20_002674 [Parelaphostrongylus tenuis]
MAKLIESSQKPGSHCEVVVVISNKAEVKCSEVSNKMGVETIVIPHTQIGEEGDSKITELRGLSIQHSIHDIMLFYLLLLLDYFTSNLPLVAQ